MQVREAAVKLPSDFFNLTKGRQMVCGILLAEQPSRRFVVVTPQTGGQLDYFPPIKGKEYVYPKKTT